MDETSALIIPHKVVFQFYVIILQLFIYLKTHSRTKHIETKHHFIRGCVQKGILDIKFINIDHQLANIFTQTLR